MRGCIHVPAEHCRAVQPPSIWPPTRLTASSALKSLAVLVPMWQPLTGVPACRKLGHWTLPALCFFFFFYIKSKRHNSSPPPSRAAFFPSEMGERVHNKQITQVNFLWWLLTVTMNCTTCVSAAASYLVQALHWRESLILNGWILVYDIKQVLSRLDKVSMATVKLALLFLLLLLPVCISPARDKESAQRAESWIKRHGSSRDPQHFDMK